MSDKKIAVYGAGSIGTISGAYLTQAYGKDNVTLVDAWQENVDTLNSQGARITGTANLTVPVTAVTPDKVTGQYDVVLLHTKQGFNNEVIPAIKKILKPDGTLISLQNGVPEKNITKMIPAKNVVAGTVEFGGTGGGPGVSELTTDYDAFKSSAYAIGELDGQVTDRIVMIESILSNVGGVTVSDNLMGTKWVKLLVNESFSGLSAASDATFGEVAADEVGARAALHLINEGLDAGHADGVKFATIGGADMNQLFKLQGDDFTDEQVQNLRVFIKQSNNLKASMLQDLYHHRKTEINEINGLIAAIGKEHGIPTPYNDLIIQIVTKAQDTDTLPKYDETMAAFKKLLENKPVAS
ncbi:2-dehydropantoate 2-reductase [Lentilactobacillus parabuchneri]|uniref:ketopantoate reductase family protein n=1 Tax=Lentilactobacillus parabuchneri TaxID=152331 RepID=UPI002236BB6C|nr:2-dehydropantoate 2-reductase [Lentilactobacillus parabuchneri]MCW4399587.1 2-dehydropantoate 2-reductase [Lentilactobacillus parabuchneri]